MCLQLGRQAAAALSAVNYTVLICSDIKLVSPPHLISSHKAGIEIVTAENEGRFGT